MKATYFTQSILDGDYPATIVEIGKKTVNDEELLRILAQIESPDPRMNKRRVSTLIPQHFDSHSRLAKWYEAAMHHLPADGEEPELDDMLNRRVLISIENRENPQGEVFPRIVRVEPIEPATGNRGMVL